MDYQVFMKRFPILILLLQVLLTPVKAQKAIIPGDFPDPSVIRVGDSYYASATSSNWAPAYPILKSPDLKTWEQVGSIFPVLPPWADYYFWAPELNEENGKIYVYYTAHKKGGNLCVGVASADKPEGPYTDHGPLVCQEVGSIDGFPMRDENNKLHLIWKEDGNSVGKPTPIWMQAMNEERTALTGEKQELFRNDTPWEGALVEGVSIVKHKDYFYAIYAAAGCCGGACTYGVGVARSKKLAGPWEKFTGNPVLTNQNSWVCPGHGTVVKYQGKDYFMYHGYDKQSNKYTGRQALLQRLEYTGDNWLRFTQEYVTPADTLSKLTMTDDFDQPGLDLQWNWSVFRQPEFNIQDGQLTIKGNANQEVFLGRRIMSSDYETTVSVDRKSSSWAGAALIGDEKNLVYIASKKDSIIVSAVKDGKESRLAAFQIQQSDDNLFLRFSVQNNTALRFFYSVGGNSFIAVDINSPDISDLPPWDRALRAGIMAKGTAEEQAVIDKFSYRSKSAAR
jgi:xylan 1,4-beta-xylosidase